MKIITDDIWLCPDCVQAAVNDDYTGLDYQYDTVTAANRKKEIEDGLNNLGPNLVPGNNEEEFSRRECDCCGEYRAGHRMQFAILGEDDETNLP